MSQQQEQSNDFMKVVMVALGGVGFLGLSFAMALMLMAFFEYGSHCATYPVPGYIQSERNWDA